MKLVLTLGLIALSTALVRPPPNVCRVTVRQQARNAPLNQVLVNLGVPTSCPLDGRAVIRFRTAGGGILPLAGSLVLRGSYPRQLSYWLRRGGVIEQKFSGRFVPVWRISE